jgi:hypothetical protein
MNYHTAAVAYVQQSQPINSQWANNLDPFNTLATAGKLTHGSSILRGEYPQGLLGDSSNVDYGNIHGKPLFLENDVPRCATADVPLMDCLVVSFNTPLLATTRFELQMHGGS